MTIRKFVMTFLASCFTVGSAQATTISTYENWERLTFVQGQPYPNFRLYSAAEFSAAIPEWHPTIGLDGSTYVVEHQHSVLTWGQTGTNDDFIEIDHILPATLPQLYTSFQVAADSVLQSISVNAMTASRPDLPNVPHAISLFQRIDNGAWTLVGMANVAPPSSIFPQFSSILFSLVFPDLALGNIDLGFGCIGCSASPGAGYLLGDVGISYTTGPRRQTPVPEPTTIGLTLTGIAAALSRRRRSSGEI